MGFFAVNEVFMSTLRKEGEIEKKNLCGEFCAQLFR